MLVGEIWRYPVKSMGGERLEEVNVIERGIPGDRAWAVRDEVRGGIRGAKQIADLMKFSSRYENAPHDTESSEAQIVLADDSRATTSDPNINEILSSALDHAVTLWPLMPPEDLDHYRRGAPDSDDPETHWRGVFNRLEGEPLPDMSVFPVELMEFESPLGTYFDAFPLLLMTTQSLTTMSDRVPDSQFDVRRFRPNFLISDLDSDDAFPELGWEGKRAQLGSAVLRFTVTCPRCVMVTRGFEDLPKDPKIMRTLVKENGGHMGVYASVEEPGTIHRGDSFELID